MTKDKILDISPVLEQCSPKDIRSLDIEGAPASIKQLTVVDANLNNRFNGHFKNGNDINGQNRIAIAKAIQDAKILIGFDIPSDLKALQKFNFELGEHTVVIDLYRTFLFLINNGFESSNDLKGLTLKDVSTHYGIQNQKGWHNSLVDAKVAMQLFQVMQTVAENQFWIINHGKYQSTGTILNQAGSDNTMNTMTVQDMELFDYAKNKTVPVIKIGKHLYQGIFSINGIKIVARMTSDEYKLYKKICETTPDYSLQIFYLSVLAPGAMRHGKKDLAKNSAEKKTEASNEIGIVLTDMPDKESQKEVAEDIVSTAIETKVLEK